MHILFDIRHQLTFSCTISNDLLSHDCTSDFLCKPNLNFNDYCYQKTLIKSNKIISKFTIFLGNHKSRKRSSTTAELIIFFYKFFYYRKNNKNLKFLQIVSFCVCLTDFLKTMEIVFFWQLEKTTNEWKECLVQC